MKKVFVIALILVPILSLAACSNNGNKSSNNSSVSINAATPSDESSVSSQGSSGSSSTSTSVSTDTSSSTKDIQDTGMNFTQIQAGNYSSLLGTWTEVAYAVNPQNGTGEQWKAGSLSTLSVSSDKIADGNGYLVIQGNTLKDSAGSHPLSFENNGSSLDASLTDQDVAINWSVSFYQKGAINDIEPNNGVKIDNTKNLIVIWTSNDGFEDVFAQTDASNSVANSNSKTTTSTNKINANQAIDIVKSYWLKQTSSSDQSNDTYSCANTFTADNGLTAYTIDIHNSHDNTDEFYYVTDDGALYNNCQGNSLTMRLN